MKNATIKIPKNPEKLSSFFCLRWAVLVLITITGIRYNVGMLANPIFLGRLIDGIESKDSTRKSIGFLLISYVSAILLIQLARALKRYYVRRFAFETIASRRACIFNTLRHKTTKELEKEDIGILSSKRMGDVSKAVEGRRKVTTEIFDTVVLFFVYIVYLFLFDYKITLLSLISIVFAVLASFLFRKIIYKASDKSRKENAILNQLTYDYSDNALLYRIYGRDKKNEENYDKQLCFYERASRKAQVLSDVALPISQRIGLLGLLPLRYRGTGYVRQSKTLPPYVIGTSENYWTIGVFTTYLETFVLLSKKACHTAKLFSSRESGLASYRRIIPLRKKITPYTEIDAQKGSVVLSFKDFTLKSEDKIRIKNLNLTLKDGEKLGITGPIASGKTLLRKAILKEIPYDGSLTINGKEVSRRTREELSSYLVYRGHQANLFTDTIQNNIAFGDDKDVMPYLKKVDFMEDRNMRNEKENTIVGNRGIKLSGGQQERLSLARAFYHQKKIRILDDPFNRVDLSTENTILKNLEKERSASLVLLISHRLDNFSQMDKILLLHGDGEYEIGKEEDRKNSSLYCSLKQKGDNK